MMKKFLLTGTLLLVALTIGAQIKVAPKMQKGMKKTYEVESISVIGQQDMKMTMETQIEVKDATAEGYVVESAVKATKVETDTTSIVGRMSALTVNLTKDLVTSYVTDKNGQVLRLQDYEKSKKEAENLIGKLLESVQLPDMISKDMIAKTALANVSEETMMNNVRMSNSPFALNGKTISNGMTDEFNTKEGIKMKRTYTVNADGSIQASSQMNMSQEDIIQTLINMTSGMFPGQGDTVKDQITQMVKSGMLKLSATDNATYTLGKDGWVESITSETVTECMGQRTSITTKAKLKK